MHGRVLITHRWDAVVVFRFCAALGLSKLVHPLSLNMAHPFLFKADPVICKPHPFLFMLHPRSGWCEWTPTSCVERLLLAPSRFSVPFASLF